MSRNWAAESSVGLKRKQQAIRSVGSLAIVAAGNPTPFTNPTAYQRASVAVNGSNRQPTEAMPRHFA